MPRTLPNNIVVGSDWTGPLTQAKCEWAVQTTGEQVTIYYRDVWANGLWRTRVPTVAAALGFSIAGTFDHCVARQIQPGVLCEVQLVFQLSSTPTPPTTISENASCVSESITKHPNFNAASGAGTPPDANSPWSQFWSTANKDWKPAASGTGYDASVPSYLIGLQTYEVGSSSITVQDWFDSEPDDVEPLLGMIATPPGKEAGYYLLLSGGKNPSGQFWTRRLVAQFLAGGWLTQVYPSESWP